MERINFDRVPGMVSPETRNRTSQSEAPGFAEKLEKSILEINQRQLNADQAIEQVVNGELGIHEGMLKIQEADISMRLFLQIRRKVMDAYTEIMRMQF